ncbi:MAG TPA: hypothetical protein VFB66_22230 [Tepidisphaeraceae bacterium]|nr:hypothetical protein [Tepidisphaeraceae bacterium]
MRVDKRHRSERAVTGDVTRPHIASGWLDAEAKVLVATDGHMLSIVPVDVGPRDRSGPIPPAAIAAARRGEVVARRGLVVAGDTLYRRGSHDHPCSTEAKRAKVVPTFRRGDKGTITIGLDPRFLMRLAEALGVGKFSGVCITVQVPGKDADRAEVIGPMVVTKDHTDEPELGVLMCRRVAYPKKVTP